MYFIYLKSHKKTGLNYLGHTTQMFANLTEENGWRPPVPSKESRKKQQQTLLNKFKNGYRPPKRKWTEEQRINKSVQMKGNNSGGLKKPKQSWPFREISGFQMGLLQK